MQDRLSEIKAREAAASPGPWLIQPLRFCNEFEIGVTSFDFMTDDDQVFLSKSRADIPWLIEQVERLRAENERLKNALEFIDEIQSGKHSAAWADVKDPVEWVRKMRG